MNIRKIEKLVEITKPLSCSLDGRFRHLSVILHKNRILSVGTNSKRTHPQAKLVGYRHECLHSELNAYLKLPDRNLRGLCLVNFRFNRRGELRNSCPCVACQGWCVKLFDEIWYSTSEEKMEQLCYL